MANPLTVQSYTFGFPTTAVAFLTVYWSKFLVTAWGYAPFAGQGLMLNLGIIFGVTLLTFLLDYGFFRLRLSHPFRSGFWWGLTAGLLVVFASLNTWGNPPVALALAGLTAVAAFSLMYFLEARKKRNQPLNPG